MPRTPRCSAESLPAAAAAAAAQDGFREMFRLGYDHVATAAATAAAD